MTAHRSTVINESEEVRPRVALCAHCARQREADPCGVELAPSHLGVVSGYCHDCGGGWCECRGHLPCDYCPRRNSPVVLSGLKLYAVVIPPPPPTMPSPL